MLVTLGSVAVSEPMTFRLSGNGGNCNGCEWVAAQGEITPETPQRFREFAASNGKIYNIALNSPGGNLVAGIVLGELIRAQGANTFIGTTVQMRGEGISHLEEVEPGSCASACAFAFMGGVERSVANGSLLGVHQFYNPDTPLMDAGDVQVLAGASLLHSISMGVDPRVIVAASGTAPEEIHWFRRSELIDFGLDTSAEWSDPWRLEPYKAGVILTTEFHESVRRSISVTVFCRSEDRLWRLLLTEPLPPHAATIDPSDLFSFSSQYPSAPELSLGSNTYAIGFEDIEFQRVTEDRILLSLNLLNTLDSSAGEVLSFDPDFARVFGTLLRARVELPDGKWLKAAQSNCI